MAEITVALLVTDAKRQAVIDALEAITPIYTMGFIRPCCAIGPGLTWQTPPTHWYANMTAVETSIVQDWQDATAAATVPEDALHGFIIFTAQNAVNAPVWAVSNLESQNLRFVPDEEF